MTSPDQHEPTSSPDSGAFDHFLTEVERVAADLNQEPGHEDPEPDVT